MPGWAAAGVPNFVYIATMAVLSRGLSRRARAAAIGVSATGGLAIALAAATDAFWLRQIILPPAVLLIAYWCSGLLWVAPMAGIERVLVESDRALGIQAASARMPRLVIEVLELAYAGVYPLIPIAFAIHLWFTVSPDADRFWTVILVTDFICFGMLPWIQTRPPRALEPSPPWHSPLRSFNVTLLGTASIGVNTVPSGHAAEAMAAALLVSDAPWPIAAWMWFNALAISAGAVFGRYHYAVDAAAGWIVAIAVWLLVA